MTIATSLPRPATRPGPEVAVPPLKMVALGDSLTAGMQDANLCQERQLHSYPNLIARQAGLPFKQPLLDGEGAPPKLFLSPGTSLGRTAWRYAQVAAVLAPVVGAMSFGLVPPDWALTPLYHVGGMGKLAEKGDFQNFAIPTARLRHLNDVHNVHDIMSDMAQGLHSRAGIAAMGPYCKYILQHGEGRAAGKSEIDLGIAQKPDLVVFWGGNNDTLGAALAGNTGDVVLTPLEDRRWTWTTTGLFGKEKTHVSKEIMPGLESSLVGPKGSLTRLLGETKAEIMVMNVPDVTVLPNLRKVGEKVGKLPFQLVLPDGTDITHKIENWVLPKGIAGKGLDGRTEFPEGSRVGLITVLKKFTHAFQVKNMEDLDAALTSMGKSQAAFNEDQVLDPKEIGQIQQRTKEFNGLIHNLAQSNPRIHEVDVNGMLLKSASEGVALRGAGPEVIATNTFTGQTDGRGFRGIFSSDGMHPSDVGYAVLANLALDKARQDLSGNHRFDSLTQAPPVDEKAALASDPHSQARPTLVLNAFVLDRLLAGAQA